MASKHAVTEEFYTVQFGAFSNEGNARNIEHSLLAKNYKVKIVKVLNPNNFTITYKVISGFYPSKSSAKLAALAYGKIEHKPAFAARLAWGFQNAATVEG